MLSPSLSKQKWTALQSTLYATYKLTYKKAFVKYFILHHLIARTMIKKPITFFIKNTKVLYIIFKKIYN